MLFKVVFFTTASLFNILIGLEQKKINSFAMRYNADASNTTINSPSVKNKNHLFSWVVSVILGFMTLYLLLAIMIFLIRKKQNSSLFFTFSQDKKYCFVSLIVCLLVTILSLIRNFISAGGILFLDSLIELNSTSKDFKEKLMADLQLGCNITVGSGNVTFTIGTGFVYLFLWLRQRIFYIHPLFYRLRNNCVRIVSFSIIIVWLIYDVFITATYLLLVRFKYSQLLNTCLFADKLSRTWFRPIIISWATISILMQLTLLSLFVFPLLRQNSWRRKNNVGDSALFYRVKKAMFLTLLSLITDVATLILSFNFDSVAIVAFYNINLFTNNLVVIGCFDDWKAMTWPFCNKKSMQDKLSTLINMQAISSRHL